MLKHVPSFHVLGAVLFALLVSFKNKSIMKYYKCFFMFLSSQSMIYLAPHFVCRFQKYLSKKSVVFGEEKKRDVFHVFFS